MLPSAGPWPEAVPESDAAAGPWAPQVAERAAPWLALGAVSSSSERPVNVAKFSPLVARGPEEAAAALAGGGGGGGGAEAMQDVGDGGAAGGGGGDNMSPPSNLDALDLSRVPEIEAEVADIAGSGRQFDLDGGDVPPSGAAGGGGFEGHAMDCSGEDSAGGGGGASGGGYGSGGGAGGGGGAHTGVVNPRCVRAMAFAFSGGTRA